MIAQHLKLFASLNANKVEYLLIGGTLAIAYGVPRVTKDIDIFLHASVDNAERCLKGMRDCGLTTCELTSAQDLCNTEVTIFKDVVRFDVLTKVKGLEFSEAWQRRVYLSLQNIDIPALHLDDLIKSKQAAGREEDLQDIKILEMARRAKK